MKLTLIRIKIFTLVSILAYAINGVAQVPLSITPVESGITETGITALQFINDSNNLIYASNNGDISVLSILDKSTRSWSVGFDVDQLEVSPNGKYVAVSGKNKIATYEIASEKQIMSREDLDGARIFHFDPNSSNILIYTADAKRLMHHNLVTGDRMQIRTVHAIIHLLYHTSGEYLVVGTKKETYSVNLKTGNTKAFYKQNQKGESNLERLGLWDDHCWPLAFIDSGRFLATRPYGNFDSYLTIFESSTGELEGSLDVSYNFDIEQNLNPLRFSDPKSVLLVPSHSNNSPYIVDLKLFAANKKSVGVTITSYPYKKKQKGDVQVYYDITSDGNYIATYSPNSTSQKLELFKLEWP